MMLIRAPFIPATRWSCSQQSLLSVGGRLQLRLVAVIRGAQISITKVMYRSAASADGPDGCSLVLLKQDISVMLSESEGTFVTIQALYGMFSQQQKKFYCDI